jgi:hypothetical protein
MGMDLNYSRLPFSKSTFSFIVVIDKIKIDC